MGGDDEPAPPPPPDPRVVAQAQTGSNITTGIANQALGNVNQVGPMGSTSYSQTGTQTITGPNGEKYEVPRWTQTTSLSPEQQNLYNQQTQLASGLNTAASNLVPGLGQPFDLSGLPSTTNDFSADRQRVEQAMFDRLNPQMDRDRSALENQLVNQGFQRGTQAFTDAMGQFGQQVNDLRLGITGQGLQEQQGLFGMQNANRGRAFQEYMASRAQPINELTALMSGGQASMPQPMQYNAPQVGNTPIGDYIYNSAGLAQKNYDTQMQSRNAQMGGMYGLGGAALGAGAKMFMSDRRLKADIRDLGIKMMNGLKLYAYRYIGEPIERAGVMADEVLQVRPEAVAVRNGYMAVNYGAL
jgi:hypothetical protein